MSVNHQKHSIDLVGGETRGIEHAPLDGVATGIVGHDGEWNIDRLAEYFDSPRAEKRQLINYLQADFIPDTYLPDPKGDALRLRLERNKNVTWDQPL